jgi:hypothetical protein
MRDLFLWINTPLSAIMVRDGLSKISRHFVIPCWRRPCTSVEGFIAYRSHLISYRLSGGGVIPQPFCHQLHFSNSLPSTSSMGTKRSWEGQAVVKMDSTESASPTISIFENFRDELDEHHDRREHIIKASRDITALSKKM